MRDDFSQKTKEKLASRVAHRCSNPDCRAPTSGPQLHPDKSVNVGVAAHITAAAAGGPRCEPTMSALERTAIRNGIWLCQTCAKLVDSDDNRYSMDVLVRWKMTAEREAQRQVGKARVLQPSPLASAERRIKNDLKMRDTLRADLLKGAKEYAEEYQNPNKPVRRPYDKFRRSEVIIHRVGDDCYPKNDDRPGISSWFKLELFDFYERGLVVVLGIERGVIAAEIIGPPLITTRILTLLSSARSRFGVWVRFHSATFDSTTQRVIRITRYLTCTAHLTIMGCHMRSLHMPSSAALMSTIGHSNSIGGSN